MQITELPFVKITDGHVNPWSYEDIPGPHSAKNALGWMYAEELLRYMRESGNTTILGSIVRSMRNEFGPVEIGFLQRISEHLISGHEGNLG